MILYSESSTVVRMGQRGSKDFDMKLVARQSSIFSPLLFVIVIDIVIKTARGELPWELLYKTISSLRQPPGNTLEGSYGTLLHGI